MCPATVHRYRRNLPHFQSPGAWFHLVASLRPEVSLSPEERTIVLRACRFQEERAAWRLGACVVMPRLGMHVLAAPLPRAEGGWHRLEEVLHSVKSFSAHQINRMRQRSGHLWERETRDRTIRNRDDLVTVLHYIANNPVEGGLVGEPYDYPWLYVAEEFAEGLFGVEFGSMR